MSQKELPAIPEHVKAKFMWRGQAKGWVTSEIMQESIDKVFIPEVEARRSKLSLPVTSPALLVMDGHKSHDTEKLRASLAAHHITLRLFVPHASHIMQPLDLVLFFKFKTLLRKQIDEMINDDYQVLTEVDRRNFYLEAASEVVPLAFSSSSIRSAFRRAGLWPINANPVLNNPCGQSSHCTDTSAPWQVEQH